MRISLNVCCVVVFDACDVDVVVVEEAPEAQGVRQLCHQQVRTKIIFFSWLPSAESYVYDHCYMLREHLLSIYLSIYLCIHLSIITNMSIITTLPVIVMFTRKSWRAMKR